MNQALKLHPDSRPGAATKIEVLILRPRPGILALDYVVTGKTIELSLPSVTASSRTDELWQHTCFEAFVRAPSGGTYYEFNFVPSTQWAAYEFTGYRDGMRVVSEMSPPRIEVQTDEKFFRLRASLDLNRLPGLPGDACWHLGASAVIEETGGEKSFWALAHPPGKADFHHREGFTCVLEPEETIRERP